MHTPETIWTAPQKSHTTRETSPWTLVLPQLLEGRHSPKLWVSSRQGMGAQLSQGVHNSEGVSFVAKSTATPSALATTTTTENKG